MFETFERAFQIDLVREIADALRREFGPEIDVHPGPAEGEAGVVNQAFHASTWIILETMALPSGDLRSLMTWVLRWPLETGSWKPALPKRQPSWCSIPSRFWAIRG
jgi:hypothetical protein